MRRAGGYKGCGGGALRADFIFMMGKRAKIKINKHYY